MVIPVESDPEPDHDLHAMLSEMQHAVNVKLNELVRRFDTMSQKISHIEENVKTLQQMQAQRNEIHLQESILPSHARERRIPVALQVSMFFVHALASCTDCL